MHSTTVKIKGRDERGNEVDIHHHGDWSGDAIINLPMEEVEIMEGNKPKTGRIEIRIPGELLMKIAKVAVSAKLRDDTIAFLEDWEP